jgi:hypothetical protein
MQSKLELCLNKLNPFHITKNKIMKKQKETIKKKLLLSKEALVQLNQMQMTKIVGGYPTVDSNTIDHSNLRTTAR